MLSATTSPVQEYVPSPRALRRRAIAGAIAAAPAVYFLAANVLRHELGIEGNYYLPIDLVTATPDRARIFNAISPLVFVGGLLTGAALNLFPLVRWRARVTRGALWGRIRVRISTLNMLVASICSGALGVLMLYLLMENLHHMTR